MIGLPRISDAVDDAVAKRVGWPGVKIKLAKKDATQAYEQLFSNTSDVWMFATDRQQSRSTPLEEEELQDDPSRHVAEQHFVEHQHERPVRWQHRHDAQQPYAKKTEREGGQELLH